MEYKIILFILFIVLISFIYTNLQEKFINKPHHKLLRYGLIKKV